MKSRVRGRFLILQVIVLVAGLTLAARVIQIQVFRHKELRAVAERTWGDDIAIPPERGNLYDRGLRPLALSVSQWRVGVATSLLGDRTEAVATLLGGILDQDPQVLARTLKAADGGHVVVSPGAVLTREEMMDMQAYRAITVEDLRARVYPFDGLAASLVGFYRKDPEREFAEGLENSLREYLAGRPGRARVITTGKTGQNLGQVEMAPAHHGKSLVLTLDTDLQDLCEDRLRRSVRKAGAVGGSVLVLDPSTGDILAAASWPLMESREQRHADSRVWQNRNFTVIHEPGSVFKIFSAASLLKRGAIDTVMVFDCTSNDIGDGIRIDNDEGHAYGDLPFMPAFARSSNIFFARAVANLRDEELHQDLQSFGFGQDTGVPYPATSAGILRSPDQWSRRSKPTLAIGQEVAVTPLQLGLAVCAVANGGTLYAPRLISEVRDGTGAVVERRPPHALRRVISEPLAALLREAMGRVVEHGTGVAAAEDWIRCGGKTGTAEKSVDGGGYTPGAYVASFAGIVPVDDPRLVILTVLDEPQGHMHYASQSAVPLFREVVMDIRARTDYLTDAPGARTAALVQEPDRDLRVVPDVLHLSLAGAAEHLRRAGLQVSGEDKGGLVLQQVPLPGSRVPEGSVVRLSTGPAAGEDRAVAQLIPDFRGLSNRQARSLAARLGLDVVIQGVGYAVTQMPAPGAGLGGEPVKIRMEARW